MFPTGPAGLFPPGVTPGTRTSRVKAGYQKPAAPGTPDALKEAAEDKIKGLGPAAPTISGGPLLTPGGR